ncbi:MAG: BREX system ATP-binding domain-containing protein [bacterium]
MKILKILEKYSDAAIDQLAADKVDESANLRLPRTVIVQEIASALSSLTYVAGALAPSRPPTYAFLKLLLEAPNHQLPIEGFQETVMQATKEMTTKAQTGKGLSEVKNYKLYINVLKNAWESDNEIDRSEALLLEALRIELGIWTREHLLLEHHPDIRQLWDVPGAYVSARNHLLLTGLVLTYEHNYLLAEEVALQIRRAWGIDLEKDAYERLLSGMKNEQLYNALEKTGLQVSGSKEEKIQRLINALVPPSEFLDFLHIDEVREFCRHNGIQISGRKAEVISNIVDHFDRGGDLKTDEEEAAEPLLPPEPEERELNDDVLTKFLQNLTTDQLYDVLSQSHLRTSGNKDEKVKRLAESPWSERSMLSRLRRIDLSNLCRKLGIQVSGVKNELIERLVEGAATRFSETTVQAVEQDQESHLEAKSEKISEETPDVSEIVDSKTQAEPPMGFKELSKEFPELDPDEQIILSLIRETKSLTEYDIERASRRHGLGWFLTKAHMSEMAAKLRKSGKSPLRVRSVRSVNIYEWIGEKLTEKGSIERRSARDVIDALRQGVVPDRNLDLLIIGQSKPRDHLKELLHEAQNNKSPFKFIRGPYGAGKTFLCSWLREYALNNDFAVSTVNIGPDQPLSDLPIFYSGLINGLRTFEKRDSSALVDILESWLLNIHRKTAQIEGLTALDDATQKKLTTIVERMVESELTYLADLDPGFAPALRAFYRARSLSDQVTASTAVAWLSGSRAMANRNLKEIGVRGYLEANQVFPRIRALLEVIKGARYQGLLLLVDELELIRRFPHARQREQALEILRLLIDESGKNGFSGCLLMLTGTDTFFEDDRAGLKSYEALSERVIVPNAPEGMISMRQPVITLEGLNKPRLLAVAGKVRDIHGIAYNWNSQERLPDEALEKLVKDWTAFGEESVSRKPRPILRELINILDLCEENPSVSYSELFQIGTDNKDMAAQITNILNR